MFPFSPAALARFAHELGRVSPKDWHRIAVPTTEAPMPDPPRLTVPEDPETRLRVAANELGVQVLDLRGHSRKQHHDPKEWGWFRDDDPKRNLPLRGRARGRLPWKKRTGILLHITAVKMGAKRFVGTPCHDAIAKDGTIVLCHPHDAYVFHGHAANRFTNGVEISSKAGEITPLQLEAAKVVVRYIAEDVRGHTSDDFSMVLMAHRQSHASRERDPGQKIWRELAPWADAELGLREGPVVGSGKEIPRSWYEGVIT